MSEETRAKLDDDPVCRRIARILDAKRRENEKVLGALKAVDDAWEGLNKEVDAAIGTEFDLMEVERVAVLAAKKRLKKSRVVPVDEGFVLGGKVRDDDKKVGLPGVLVRLVREKDGEEEVLAETVTDQMGNFAGLVPKAKLRAPTAGRGGETLRIEALSKAGERPLFTMKKRLVLEAGKVKEVELEIRSVRKIADRLTAAETVRDSVEESVEVVGRRIASMKASHTAVSRFAGLTRDGLTELREELAVEPPKIVAAVPVAGIEPEPPKEEEKKQDEKEEKPKKPGQKIPVGKTAAKKTPVRKKATKKTPVGKKAAKKTPVRKKAAKKTPVRKKATKKTPVGKKAAKKTLVGKRAAKKKLARKKPSGRKRGGGGGS